MKLNFLALSAFLALVGGRASAQVAFDDCGTMISGVTCPLLFQDSQNLIWLLSNTGGYSVGAQVRVTGSADPFCFTACQQGGCVQVATIGPCITNPGTPYCFGDGSGAACPCGNTSAVGAGRGCANSIGNSGKLTATGVASVSADTVVLTGDGMPNGPVLYFQGTTQIGVTFGDGIRCSGGAIVRLAIKTNVGGTSQFPIAGDPSLSVRGGAAPGSVLNYQVWYRDSAAFCSASTFNLTNGHQLLWSN